MIAYMLIGKLFSHLKLFTMYVCLYTLIVLKKQLKQLACAEFLQISLYVKLSHGWRIFKLTTNDTM